MIPLLDVGSPQGVLTDAHWKTMREDGKLGAILRCEQGAASKDGTFARNLDGARAAGLLVGAYFVFIPGLTLEQAPGWFGASGGLGTGASGRGDELPPAIDFEIASKTLTSAEELSSLVVTIRTMTLLWGRPPLLYTYPDFWRRLVLTIATPAELAILATCPLWFASYETDPPAPPKPWTKITIWQSSGGSKYRTPTGRPCDLDYFLGEEAELRALAAFTAGAPPPGWPGIPLVNPLAGDTSTLAIDLGVDPDDEPPPTSRSPA